MTTTLTKFVPSAPLGRAESVLQLGCEGNEMMFERIVRAWPDDDINEHKRIERTKRLILEAKTHIELSKAGPFICRCLWASVVDSLVDCARFNLTLSRSFGEAYLIPYGPMCTLYIGYRGFIKLITNTGFVSHISSTLIYEGEEFEPYHNETGPHFKHEPDLALQGDATKVTGAYVVGYTRGGAPPLFELMNLKQLEKVRGSSPMVQSGKKGPYDYWTTEMYRKAPIRRLQKYIPKTADNLAYRILDAAIEQDNKQHNLEEKYAEEIQEGKDKREADWEKRIGSESPPAEQEKPEPERAEDGEIVPPEVGQDQKQ